MTIDPYDKHPKALYRLLMVLAAADRDFDEAENDFILDVVRRVFGDQTVSRDFVATMSREFETAIRTRKALTQQYFDRQAKYLGDLTQEARQRILAVMQALAKADGRATHRERYLLDKLKTALDLNETGKD